MMRMNYQKRGSFKCINSFYKKYSKKLLSLQECIKRILHKNKLSFFRRFIEVQNFQTDNELNNEMKNYLKHLKLTANFKKGDIADFIKIISIIKNKRQCQHINIDSNTIIKDYSQFYHLTFGSSKVGQASVEKSIKINAIFYGKNYVSAHNKVVYTSKESPLGDILQYHLEKYCRNYIALQNQLPNSTLYSQVFISALSDIGLLKPFYSIQKQRLIYLPDFSSAAYDLTRVVVSAINQSWKFQSNIKTFSIKTKIIVRDAEIGQTAFSYLIKKYCSSHYWHSQIGLSANDIYQKRGLLSISDANFDRQAITKFINAAKQFESDKILSLLNEYR